MTKSETPRVAPLEERVTGVRAAQILGVDRRTITRWAERGKFPGARRAGKLGADWSIPIEAVNALALEKKERKPMSHAQFLEQVNAKYVDGMAVLMTAAAQALDRHNVVMAALSTGATPGDEATRAYQQGIELLMDAALSLEKISTVRANMIALALEVETPTHPEDAGPIR